MNQKNTFLVVQPKFLIELAWEVDRKNRVDCSCNLMMYWNWTQKNTWTTLLDSDGFYILDVDLKSDLD